MSAVLELNKMNAEKRVTVSNDLRIRLEPSKYNRGAPASYITPYHVDGDKVYVPFSYGYSSLNEKRKSRDEYPSRQIDFQGNLRPEQKVVRKEALSVLSKSGSILLAMFPGFGKTITVLNLCSRLRFKTLFIVNKIVLINQIKDSIHRFCPNATVQKLTPKSKKEDCDFYIMNALNIPKMSKDYFEDIGTVVVDECHLIMAERLSQSLQFLNPRYLIGLSATPYRPDGLNILLDLYFGTDKIVRELQREHIVYKIETGIVPEMEYAKNGKVNWGSVLDSQANNESRNEMIINIVKNHSERKFLILTKRVSQGEYLQRRFEEEGISVDSLLGSKTDYDKNASVLIGTNSKLGTGFDHPSLNALILASDLEEYFIQFLGRVFRTEDGIPIVFDLVDNNPILKKHFLTRQNVYIQHGGKLNLELSD